MSSVLKAQTVSQNFDKLFNYLKDKDDFNGNVLFADKGKIVYQKSFGYANFTTKALLNENSMFVLASLSKQFTSMAILILSERGKLSLNDMVNQYFVGFPYTNVTIRNLLSHTSGIPDYRDLIEDHWDKSKIAYNKDVISLLVKYRPAAHFNAGDHFEYSNINYVLLTSIIEKVSGLSYAEFLKKNIFEPLGMTRTRVYNTRRADKEVIPNYAYGYIITKDGPALPDSLKVFKYVIYRDGIVGAGGVNSTTVDLLKWDRALYTEKLVKASTLNKAFTPFKFKNGNEDGYGFGWALRLTDKSTGKCVYHLGSWVGYNTFISRFIDNDKTIIVLRNTTNHNKVDGIYEAYINILFAKPFELPKVESR